MFKHLDLEVLIPIPLAVTQSKVRCISLYKISTHRSTHVILQVVYSCTKKIYGEIVFIAKYQTSSNDQELQRTLHCHNQIAF